MVETAAMSVLELVGKIDSIERETEDIYLRLGEVFKAVKYEVDSSATDAEKAIVAVLSIHRGGASAEAARRRSEDFIEDATRYFKKVSAIEGTFLEGVENGIKSLSMLDDIISRIRADSEEMEIISLNAMTVALKSGAAGRAFSVITDELKRLSGRTIHHADDLSGAGSALLERLGELRSTLAALVETQLSFFQSARAALEKGFVSLESEIERSAREIRNLSGQALRVREPISAIMEEVQLQDIIRQSLDHVRLALGAADGNTAKVGGAIKAGSATDGATGNDNDNGAIDPDEEMAFLSEITRLSSSLLDDVSSQVRASLSRFKAGIEGVSAVMASVESARLEVIVSRSGESAGAEYEARAVPYIAAKENAVSGASAIADGVRRLDERFKEMNVILARFMNIVTASRIETARNKTLAIVSTTVAGMMDLTERLSDDVSAAGGVTRSFAKTLSTGMSDYLSVAEETMAELKVKVRGLKDEFDRIEESRGRLWGVESEFRPFSENFSKAIKEASGSVERIGVLAVELEDMRDVLEACAKANDARPDGVASLAGVASKAPLHSRRLRTIVDRFTIFAHKQTAARIARLASDADDSAADSGEVTLF